MDFANFIYEAYKKTIHQDVNILPKYKKSFFDLDTKQQKIWIDFSEQIKNHLKKPKKEITAEEKQILKEKRLLNQKRKNDEEKELSRLKEDSRKYHELQKSMQDIKISFD